MAATTRSAWRAYGGVEWQQAASRSDLALWMRPHLPLAMLQCASVASCMQGITFLVRMCASLRRRKLLCNSHGKQGYLTLSKDHDLSCQNCDQARHDQAHVDISGPGIVVLVCIRRPIQVGPFAASGLQSFVFLHLCPQLDARPAQICQLIANETESIHACRRVW